VNSFAKYELVPQPRRSVAGLWYWSKIVTPIGVEKFTKEGGNLYWLLLRGPARRVWPVATVNAGRASQVEVWLEAFRTRVFGRIEECYLVWLREKMSPSSSPWKRGCSLPCVKGMIGWNSGFLH